MPYKVEPSGETLGCSIYGIDLSKPFGKPELGFVLQALADLGVVCFPNQSLDPRRRWHSAVNSANWGGMFPARSRKRMKPSVSQPTVLVDPISGRQSLSADPGYTVSIDGMDKQQSDELLDFLFRHQLRPGFQYAHRWNEGDVLVWDNLQTLHAAEADYRADEPRLIKRCQAMADRVFTLEFAHLAQEYGQANSSPCAYSR